MQPIDAFVNLVRENARPGMVVIEVGVWQGDTALAWLPIVKAHGGRGILVDHFKGNLTAPPGFCLWDPEQADSRCNAMADRIIVAGLEDVSEIWQTNSLRASRDVLDGDCDIVFIDADHRYSQVIQDIAAWRPKVRPGGILCGHDVYSLRDAMELSLDVLEVDYHNGRHCGVDRSVAETFGVDGVCIFEDIWVWRYQT